MNFRVGTVEVEASQVEDHQVVDTPDAKWNVNDIVRLEDIRVGEIPKYPKKMDGDVAQNISKRREIPDAVSPLTPGFFSRSSSSGSSSGPL